MRQLLLSPVSVLTHAFNACDSMRVGNGQRAESQMETDYQSITALTCHHSSTEQFSAPTLLVAHRRVAVGAAFGIKQINIE